MQILKCGGRAKAPRMGEKSEKKVRRSRFTFFCPLFSRASERQKTLARASFARPLTKFEHKSFDLSFFSYIDMIEIK